MNEEAPADRNASDQPASGQQHEHAAEQPPATGVHAADEARQRLSDVAEAPLEEHVDVYEGVHRALQEGLADLDER